MKHLCSWYANADVSARASNSFSMGVRLTKAVRLNMLLIAAKPILTQ